MRIIFQPSRMLLVSFWIQDDVSETVAAIVKLEAAHFEQAHRGNSHSLSTRLQHHLRTERLKMRGRRIPLIVSTN